MARCEWLQFKEDQAEDLAAVTIQAMVRRKASLSRVNRIRREQMKQLQKIIARRTRNSKLEVLGMGMPWGNGPLKVSEHEETKYIKLSDAEIKVLGVLQKFVGVLEDEAIKKLSISHTRTRKRRKDMFNQVSKRTRWPAMVIQHSWYRATERWAKEDPNWAIQSLLEEIQSSRYKYAMIIQRRSRKILAHRIAVDLRENYLKSVIESVTNQNRLEIYKKSCKTVEAEIPIVQKARRVKMNRKLKKWMKQNKGRITEARHREFVRLLEFTENAFFSIQSGATIKKNIPKRLCWLRVGQRYIYNKMLQYNAVPYKTMRHRCDVDDSKLHPLIMAWRKLRDKEELLCGLKVHSLISGAACRNKYLRQKQAALAIQTGHRGYIARINLHDKLIHNKQTKLDKEEKAATTIQNAQRSRVAKKELNLRLESKRILEENKIKNATVCIQSRFRLYSAQKYTKLLRQERKLQTNAAVKIQTQYRGYYSRQTFQDMKEDNFCACTIQRVYRGYVDRENTSYLKECLKASLLVQRTFRGFLGRERAREIRDKTWAAISIQAVARGGISRERYYNLLHRHDSATSIQAIVRGVITRQLYGNMVDRHRAAICIQTGARHRSAIKRVAAIREAHELIMKEKIEMEEQFEKEENDRIAKNERAAIIVQRGFRSFQKANKIYCAFVKSWAIHSVRKHAVMLREDIPIGKVVETASLDAFASLGSIRWKHLFGNDATITQTAYRQRAGATCVIGSVVDEEDYSVVLKQFNEYNKEIDISSKGEWWPLELIRPTGTLYTEEKKKRKEDFDKKMNDLMSLGRITKGMTVRTKSEEYIKNIPLSRWIHLFDEHASVHRGCYPLWCDSLAIVEDIDDSDHSVKLKNFLHFNPNLPKIEGGAWWPVESLDRAAEEHQIYEEDEHVGGDTKEVEETKNSTQVTNESIQTIQTNAFTMQSIKKEEAEVKIDTNNLNDAKNVPDDTCLEKVITFVAECNSISGKLALLEKNEFCSNVIGALSITLGALSAQVDIISGGDDPAAFRATLLFGPDESGTDHETANAALQLLKSSNINETIFNSNFGFNSKRYGIVTLLSAEMDESNSHGMLWKSVNKTISQVAIKNEEEEANRMHRIALQMMHVALQPGDIVKTASHDEIARLPVSRWRELFDEHWNSHRTDYQTWSNVYARVESVDNSDHSIQLKNFTLYNKDLPTIEGGGWWPLELLHKISFEEEQKLEHKIRTKRITKLHQKESGFSGFDSQDHSGKDIPLIDKKITREIHSIINKNKKLLKKRMTVRTAKRAFITRIPMQRWVDLFADDAKKTRRNYVLWADSKAQIDEEIDFSDNSVCLKNFRKFDPNLPIIDGGAWWPLELIQIEKNTSNDTHTSNNIQMNSTKPETKKMNKFDGKRSMQDTSWITPGVTVRTVNAAAIHNLDIDRWEHLFDNEAEKMRHGYALWSKSLAVVESIDRSDNSVQLKRFRSYNPDLPEITGGAWWPIELVEKTHQ